MMREKKSPQLSSPPPSPTVEVCDICGDVGVVDSLVRCSKCKINRQHIYCRKTIPENIDEEWDALWECDECKMGTMASPKYSNKDLNKTSSSKPSPSVNETTSTHLGHNGRHFRGEKMVTKGKVKCIPSEEVIKLSSGSRKDESPFKTFKHSTLSPPRNAGKVFPKTPIHKKGVTFKFPVISPRITDSATKAFVAVAPARAEDSISVKEKNTPNEELCAPSTGMQFLAPRSPVRASVGTKVASPRKGKYSYKENEASNALSPKKQFQQPISPGVTSVKETRKLNEDLSPPIGKQFLSPISPVLPAVETQTVKEINLPTEVSCTPSLKKQFMHTFGAKYAVTVKETNTLNEDLSSPSTGKQFLATISPVLPAEETITEKEMNFPTPSYAPALKKQFMQQRTSGDQDSGNLDPKVFDKSEMMKMEHIAKIQGPALASSWRGRFEILGGTFQNINSWFKAHHRSKVSRNVVDVLSRMPELLQFKLIPRRLVWTELFQDDCPDEDDIGLYFFSAESKRSSDYDFLLTFIESQDLAMRCDVTGAELFLFTSKILFAADSQKLNEKYFLWGVFHKIKKQKYVAMLYEELPAVVHKPVNSPENNNIDKDDDDDFSGDMEIDMLAGIDIGKIDIAVPKVSSSVDYSSEGHVMSSPLQVIKKELCLYCPPGFEEMHRLKFQKN